CGWRSASSRAIRTMRACSPRRRGTGSGRGPPRGAGPPPARPPPRPPSAARAPRPPPPRPPPPAPPRGQGRGAPPAAGRAGRGARADYVVSEALTNVAKYAQATGARVAVQRDDSLLVVTVADDGVGGADASRGSGLRGLADRVEALGGRLEVASPEGGGTTLRATLPCLSEGRNALPRVSLSMGAGGDEDGRRRLDEAVATSIARGTAWVRQRARAGDGAADAGHLRLEGAADLRRRLCVATDAVVASEGLTLESREVV